MVISSIRRLEDEISSLQSIVSSYSEDWDDIVSMHVFNCVDTLTSNLTSLYSEMDSEMKILIGFETEISSLLDR